MAGLAQHQQQADRAQARHQAQPAAAAVAEHQGGAAEHQGGKGIEPLGPAAPTQEGHHGQGQDRQQVAGQQVGVLQGAVDPDRAVGHGVGIGPAGQFAGVAVELADRDHGAGQFAG